MVKFVAAPRSVVDTAVGESEGWRRYGERMLAHVRELCPVGEDRDDGGGHLRDSLELRVVTGADPRLMIGSRQMTTGDKPVNKLALVIEGTPAHPIDPVNATVLVFTKGKETVFARHVDHPETVANNFVMRGIEEITRSDSA